MTLDRAFAKSAATHAGKTAVFWGEREFSHRCLWHQATWFAHRLQQEFRVKPGDRVGLLLKNRPEFIPALFGIVAAGAVVTPINHFLKPDEILRILADAGIDLLITERDSTDHLTVLQANRPGLRVLPVEELPAVPETPFLVHDSARAGGDTAMLIYTSGTTGLPKGIMLSHANLLHNVESCRIMLEAVEGDRFAIILPMFHSFMLTVGVLLPILVGGSVVLARSIHPMKHVIDEIVGRKVSLLPAVPALFRSFIHAAPAQGLPLRICISGGAALPVEILREFQAKFSFPLIEGYGLSETSPVACLNPIHGPWKSGSIGLPIPQVELSIQDDLGRQLPTGETGEVCIRGGNVMQGYWNQPEETARVLRDGWLATGDIGHRDTDGYYFITDRKKDMIIVNGINVYSREVEEAIYRFPGVHEAAVIGQPDQRRGEHPVAFVVLAAGAANDEQALLHYLRGHLADYKVPRRIHFIPTLPRNATGKVLKTALREISSSVS